MGLPRLKGDPCWVYAVGPYNLEKRNEIRTEAKEDNPNRKFKRIFRNKYSLTAFDFNDE